MSRADYNFKMSSSLPQGILHSKSPLLLSKRDTLSWKLCSVMKNILIGTVKLSISRIWPNLNVLSREEIISKKKLTVSEAIKTLTSKPADPEIEVLNKTTSQVLSKGHSPGDNSFAFECFYSAWLISPSHLKIVDRAIRGQGFQWRGGNKTNTSPKQRPVEESVVLELDEPDVFWRGTLRETVFSE